VRVGMEVSFEVWIDDPAEIKAKCAKKQRDRQQRCVIAAEGDRFPRMWVPSPENRDVR
jgi:hypothetical protein